MTTSRSRRRYWVAVTWQDGEWRPADNLPMPHHHATRLELTNVAAFPSLAKHRDVRVRLTIDITSRDIRKVPNRERMAGDLHSEHRPGVRAAGVGVALAVMAKVLVTGSAGTVGRPAVRGAGRAAGTSCGRSTSRPRRTSPTR